MALRDDFERDYWSPYTHFHLGDLAFAGYADGVARSGTRAYRVAIDGWRVRDFGNAYGYAVFATHGAPLTEFRLSLFYDSLADASPSPSDAFAAGVELRLLDADYRSLSTHRYVSGYRASLNGGRCGPTTADVVLDREPTMRTWVDIGRNPQADFPVADWSRAAYVKVAVGFLCASGLTGASYSLHFDDFAIATDGGDRDGDGLSDLEEESRIHVAEVDLRRVPVPIPARGVAEVFLPGPRVLGEGLDGLLRLDVAHPSPEDLSVFLGMEGDQGRSTTLVWDPGFHEREIVLLEPSDGAAVSRDVVVEGTVASTARGDGIELRVDGRVLERILRPSDGAFRSVLPVADLADGEHRLVAGLTWSEAEGWETATTPEIRVVVDRTAPEVLLVEPRAGETVGGLLRVAAQAFDASGVARVELRVDGSPFDVRYEEPYVFAVETLDLPNGDHTLEVRGWDAAGNEGRAETVVLRFDNRVLPLPRPCFPACNLTEGTSAGDLPPPGGGAAARELRLNTSDVLLIHEGVILPDRSSVRWAPSGVVLTLRLTARAMDREEDGIVPLAPPGLDLADARSWQLIIRNHGPEDGTLETGGLLLLARTSPSAADTDLDGLGDADEVGERPLSPVMPDGDHDFLSDGEEEPTRAVEFWIDGRSETRTIRTEAWVPDMDGDGLLDGIELRPPSGWNATDPTDPDTDDEGLEDGAERLVHGTDPTRRDTDAEGLTDAHEVHSRPFSLQVNGTLRDWDLRTSPLMADTDDDGLSDAAEELGPEGRGPIAHPELADTDEDGLNDSEEWSIGTDGFSTNVLENDTDGDGVWDVFDRSPHREARIGWETLYPTGLVRFEQEVLAFSLKGVAADVWKEIAITGNPPLCVYWGSDLSGSTVSSEATPDNVVGSINEMFRNGGEARYAAISVAAGDPSWSGVSTLTRSFGTCGDGESPSPEYFIAYEIHRDAFRTDFLNVEPVTIEDERGDSFVYNYSAIPVEDRDPFSIIIQFSLPAGDDRSYYNSDIDWQTPAFTYVVFAYPDYASAPVLHAGTVFATDLNEHAYRAELRIPKEVVRDERIGFVDGARLIGLYISPQWLGRHAGNPTRFAMDGASVRVASITRERPSAVHSLVARLDSESVETLSSLMGVLSGSSTGYADVEGSLVYIFRALDGVPFDSEATASADAILFVAESEEDLFAARETVDWGIEGSWYITAEDPWRNAFKVFKTAVSIVKTSISVDNFLHMLAYRYADPGQYLILADAEHLILLEKSQVGDDFVYAISRAESRELLLVEVASSGEVVIRRQTSYRITTSEITTDVSSSRILSERYDVLRRALRGIGAAAVLATSGREAVIAFRDGDFIKGLVYGSSASLGIAAIYKGEVKIARVFGISNTRLGSVRVGSLAAVVGGSLIAGYELHQATTAENELKAKAHFERAAASGLDTAIAVVPRYGATILFSWSITNLGMSVVMPNRLASRITSSPGSIIVFFFEYGLTGTIPSDIALSVLDDAIAELINQVQMHNGPLGRPSVPVLP